MTDYPEHEKLKAVHIQSQACGEFLEWLAREKNYSLCYYYAPSPEEDDDGAEEGYVPVSIRIEDLLAEHFGIDLNKLEAEKRAMLDEFRKGQTE